MKDVFVIEALRTPIGSFNGSLSSLKGHELGACLIKELMSRTKIDPQDITEVILGQVLTAAQGQNPARQATINGGLPFETSAWIVGKVCGSGLKAISLAAQAIKTGEASFIIAGGQESMSQSPHAIHMRNGVRMGDGKLTDTMIKDGLWDAFNDYHMGITGENVSEKYGIPRIDQDILASESQRKASHARSSGKFKDEIVPVSISTRKGDIIVDEDEFIKPDTSVDRLSKLKPAFDKNGTVTAGNASGVNDGAAILLLASKEMVEKYNLKPIAKIVSSAQAGVDPAIMGIAPIYAVSKAIEKAGWKMEEVDLIEANEAFASQSVAVNKEMKWPVEKVNVNGGAIALGHPIGASGARIVVTLLHEMKRSNAKKGIATLCIGGGMGIAVCFEKVV